MCVLQIGAQRRWTDSPVDGRLTVSPSFLRSDPQLLLLGGCTLLAFLVERDFVLAGAFADFLRSSNVAFLGTCVPTPRR